MNKTHKLLFLAFFMGMFFSCEKERNNNNNNQNPIPSKGLLIGNEGSYGTNTASISLIDLSTNLVTNNVYKTKNGEPLGDVLQSITRIGDRFYFVVNNSNKIVVTDTIFKKVGEIKNVSSPRFMQAISASRAYVSSLFNDKLYIVDLVNNTKVAEIKMDKFWTEQMTVTSDATGNYLFVCENDTAVNYITKINIATNAIVDRITIGGVSPSQIGKTTDNHLWILAGNNYYGKVSTLTELDPVSNQIMKTFTFDPKYTTGQMAIGPNNEKYVAVVDYTTNSYGVYQIKNGAIALPTNFFVSTPASANHYGLTVDPFSGDVYISDSKGFTQAGDVNRYNSAGTLLNSWTTAIGPSSFYFVQ